MLDTLRVLMFGWEFPPFQAGGLATATLGLVKGLLGRGVDVTLVVPFPIGEMEIPGLRLVSAPDFEARLMVRRVASPLLPYASATQYLVERLRGAGGMPPSVVYGADLFAEVDRFTELATEIARAVPHDVIDAHDWITYGAGVRAHEGSGRPFVAHIHATEYDRSGEGANRAIVERERLGLHAATRVISNSHVLKRRVIDDYAVPPDRIDVVHWGIDGGVAAPVRVSGLKAHPVVLFLGRVTRQKGPYFFMDVARQVADLLPQARFIVAGDGDQLPEIMGRAAELGIADRVLFTGGLHGADVDRAYRMADVCVMPSVNEPFGLVALESLRNGTPCIVPLDSGVAEVLDNVFKADFWDIGEIADKVVALARYRVLHAEMRDRGLAEVAEPRFTLDEPARKTEEVYRRAIHLTGATR